MKSIFKVVVAALALVLGFPMASRAVVTDTPPANNIKYASAAITTVNLSQLSANSVVVVPNSSAYNTAIFNVSGTWAGSFVIEGTVDGGSTWQLVQGITNESSSGPLFALANFSSGAGTTFFFRGNIAGYAQLRIRTPGSGTGTTVVTGTLSSAPYLAMNVTLPVQLQTGGNSIGTVVNGAGSAIIGKVTTDQTTHGTTDLVAADVTKVNGVALGSPTAAGTSPSGNILGVQGATGGVPLPTSSEPIKGTFFASSTALAGVAGDTFVLTGSASKTIRIRRVTISGLGSAAAMLDLSLIKRTTADTAGTAGTAPTIGLMDSTNAAASATITVYTAAPTTGTSGGTVFTQKYLGQLNTAVPMIVSKDWLNNSAQAPVLRGVAQQLVVNMSAALTGGSWDISVEWSEE